MKRVCCRRPRVSRGFGALIEIIIVAVLIVGGIAMYMSFANSSKQAAKALDTVTAPTEARDILHNTQPQSLAGKAVRKAISVECQQNLRQCRMLIMNAKSESENGAPPATLAEIRETERIRYCPVGKMEYAYDAASGEVHCLFSGHEQY